MKTDMEFASKKEIAVYGIANGGQVLGYGLAASYLTYYYINVFQIDPKIVSAVFFFGGIWDIINNPLMGIVIDRKRCENGRLGWFLRRFTFPLGAATVLLFAGPYLVRDTSPLSVGKIAFFIVSYFLWELLYTVTDVAFGGLCAAFSPLPEDRRRAISASNIFQTIASALVFTAVPLSLDLTAGGKVGASLTELFFFMGLFAGVFGCGLFSLSGFFVKERVLQTQKAAGIREIVSAAAHNKPLLLLMLSNFIIALGSVGNALSTYYYIDVLGYASLSIVVGAPVMVLSMASYSFIPKLQNRFNNRQILIGAKLIFAAVMLSEFLLGLGFYQNTRLMVPILICCQSISALVSGCMNAVPTELLTEAADYSEWKTGLRQEGIIFSLKNSTNKINGTLVQSIAALILSAVGYSAASSDIRAVQSDKAKLGIFAAMCLVPAVTSVLSVVPLMFYDLTGEKRETMLSQLEAKRQAYK